MSKALEAAAEKANQLPERPSNDVLLKMYALYKQATVGDVTGDRPGGFDFKAIAKFDAWQKEAGKSAEEAEAEYIALIDSLV